MRTFLVWFFRPYLYQARVASSDPAGALSAARRRAAEEMRVPEWTLVDYEVEER